MANSLPSAPGKAISGTNQDRITSLPIWQKTKEWGPAAIVFVLVIAIWQIVTQVYDVPHYLLPSPEDIVLEIKKEYAELFRHIGWTMLEAISGYLIGGSLAFFSAVLFVHSDLLERSLYPWAVILQTLPLVAIAPLLAVWLGYGVSQKIAIASIVSYFPILVNTTRGLRDISPQSLELMQILSASKVAIFFRLRLPSSLPFLFAGLKISSTLAVIGAIVGEFSGASVGIGFFIYIASVRVKTRLIFAGIAFTSIAGILFFQFISNLEKILLRWPGSEISEEEK